MSLSRIMSLLGSPRSPFSLSFQLKILALLQKLQTNQAERVCAVFQETNTSYALDYPTNDFSTDDIKNVLIQSCHALLSDCSKVLFHHSASPYCLDKINPLKPTLNISIESGKNLTMDFRRCLDAGMIPVCKKYYIDHPPTPVNDWNLVLYISMATLALLMILVALYSRHTPRYQIEDAVTPLIGEPQPDTTVRITEDLMPILSNSPTASNSPTTTFAWEPWGETTTDASTAVTMQPGR